MGRGAARHPLCLALAFSRLLELVLHLACLAELLAHPLSLAELVAHPLCLAVAFCRFLELVVLLRMRCLIDTLTKSRKRIMLQSFCTLNPTYF